MQQSKALKCTKNSVCCDSWMLGKEISTTLTAIGYNGKEQIGYYYPLMAEK